VYHDPKTVLSPKDRVKSVEVVYDKGPVDQSWSVAQIEWDGSPAIGIRWNGDSGNSKGTPQSRGNPAWFIVPSELADVLLNAARERSRAKQNNLAEGYRQMASDRAREIEAGDWTEALIGDID
jgi:hypothetical protein